MSRTTLTAEPRDASGKSPTARRLRQEGRVPGTIYARGEEPINFSTDALEIAAVMRHGATLIDIQLDGATYTSVLKEYQAHPVRGELVHVDMQRVRMDEDIKTSTSVVLVGDSIGVKAGGVLTQATTEVNISSRPDAIPEQIEVDITDLDVGGQLTLADVTPPEGVTFLDDPENTMIASMSAPRTARQQEAAEAGEGDEAAAAEAAEGEETAEAEAE